MCKEEQKGTWEEYFRKILKLCFKSEIQILQSTLVVEKAKIFLYCFYCQVTLSKSNTSVLIHKSKSKQRHQKAIK
jgi:hypothetical protein